jgi:threonine synthase
LPDAGDDSSLAHRPEEFDLVAKDGASMAHSFLTGLECPRCGRTRDPDQVAGLCMCGSPLLARYDLAGVRSAVTPAALAARPQTLWRYHELLPVRDPANIVGFGEGMTPLLPMPRLAARAGVRELWMKDDGQLPTGTFKARGAAVGVSRAAELGVRSVAMPTNGNAGAAWAAYCARAGMRSLIVMPVDAPEVNRAECAVLGAELHLVDGLISDAGRLVAKAVASDGSLFDASTLKEPYRIEGKKTIGLEIAEQLGWSLPDVILCPAGGGVGLIAIYKALLELRELGWVDGAFPRLVAVQAAGCAPIVAAFEEGARQAREWPDAKTVAFGVTVPKPLGDFLVLGALYATGGTAIAVSDQDILAAEREAAQLEGTFACPEGAACFAAALHLAQAGWLSPDDSVVALNTGTGLKYPGTVAAAAPIAFPDGVLARYDPRAAS